jgi:hypothetical protein
MKIITVPVLFLLVLIYTGCIQPEENSVSTVTKHHRLPITKPREAKPTVLPVKTGPAVPEPKARGIVVYSGDCTLYKKHTIENGEVKYIPARNAFAKIVINNLAKKFSFFFDGKLIYSQRKYLSYHDDIQGGTGFPLDGDFSAHLFTDEKTFKVYDQAGTYGSKDSFIGYEYQLANYQTSLN